MQRLKHAESGEDIERCFPAMVELRPHLVEATFASLVNSMQAQGYCLAYLEQDTAIVTVAGYRITTSLFMGKNLYVDDLVTPERFRSQGHGHTMLSALREIARQTKCRHLHLDSGTQRTQAHKFYFREGLTVSSFHFAEKL